MLKYPVAGLEGDSDSYTLLQFVEYNRYNPNSRPTERLTGSVVLPLPNQIPDTNSLNIESVDLGLYGLDFGKIMAEKGASIQDGSLSNDVQKIQSSFSLEGIGNALLRSLAVAPGIRDAALGKRLQSEAGVVQNPHTTSLFSGVQLKTHELSWRVSPRSADDAQSLNDIILFIKQRIYPATTTSTFSLEYPDEVYVDYMNVNRTGIRKSFITNFSINSGGGAGVALFKDGTPVETELSMSFTEIEIITRDELTSSEDSSDDPDAIINAE